MEHIVYLDNSSTTKPCEEAVKYINSSLCDNWGNPSSLHIIGMNAEISVSDARNAVARSLSARDDEIIFTGSGTEANNTSILSVLSSRKRGGRIITTTIEHPSVLETVKRLSDYGFDIVRISPDKNGKIPLSSLESALDDKTLLVSMMLVNNELGTVQPVEDAVKLVKKHCPNALFHCDAVQGYGKMPINVKKLGIDLLTASGHKIHGPKGIGFLYCKKGVHIKPFITGGGQESGLRSGTEPVPLICGLFGAVNALPSPVLQLEKQQKLYDYTKFLLTQNENIVVNSPDGGLPYIINISVPGYRSETLLHFLEQHNIFVSSGSACAKGEGSYVLKEIGLSAQLTDSALRISFSRFNTKEDIDKLYSALIDAQNKLRKASK